MENLSNESAGPFTEPITQNRFFPVLLSLEALFGMLSVPANLVLAWVVFRAKIYPSNLRYLLAHLSLNIVWSSLGNAIKALVLLAREACDLDLSAFRRRLIELPMTIPAGNIFYSLFGLCLERMYCSVRFRTYEKESARPWLALSFVSVIWTGSLTANLLSLPLIPRNRTVPICESILSIDPAGALKGLISGLVLELTALSVIVCVSFFDKRKLCHSAVNRAKFTLTERFQISQCVQVNRMLVPSVVLHGVCFLPNMILFLLVAYGIPMSIEVKWSLIHLAFLYRMLYAFVHPLVAFGRNARLRQYLVKNLPQFLIRLSGRWCKPPPEPENGRQSHQNAHFNALAGFWATPSEKGAKMKARGAPKTEQ